MTQSLGGGDPDVVSLKIDSENVVVRRGCLNGTAFTLPLGVAHQHLRFVGVESGAVHRPVRTVVVGEAFVGREPCSIGIDTLDLTQ